MIYTNDIKQYRYKKELNSADLMMLGCILETTHSYKNIVIFCNDIFGLFNNYAEKSRVQLYEYLTENFIPQIEKTEPYLTYTWIDKSE